VSLGSGLGSREISYCFLESEVGSETTSVLSAETLLTNRVESEVRLGFSASECRVCPCVNTIARALLAGLGPFSHPCVF
jgi:hypothetical protein